MRLSGKTGLIPIPINGAVCNVRLWPFADVALLDADFGLDPYQTSSLRYLGQTHTFIDAFASGEMGGVITRCAEAEPADGKAWIKRKSCLRSGPRLIQRAEQRQDGGESKMRNRIISVGLETSTEPSYRFGVGIELHFGEADHLQPPEGGDVARREAERFVDMGLSSAPRPREFMAKPMAACALARFRSNANARSHSAMP